MSRNIIPTGFKVVRNNKTESVSLVTVTGGNDLTGQSFYGIEGENVYSIQGNYFTESISRKIKKGEKIKVKRVFIVETDYTNPSTWKQGTNIFCTLNDREYVYFNSLEKNPIKVILKDTENGLSKVKKVGKISLISLPFLLIGGFVLFIFLKAKK